MSAPETSWVLVMRTVKPFSPTVRTMPLIISVDAWATVPMATQRRRTAVMTGDLQVVATVVGVGQV